MNTYAYGDHLNAYLLELVVAGVLNADVRPDGEIEYWCEDLDALLVSLGTPPPYRDRPEEA